MQLAGLPEQAPSGMGHTTPFVRGEATLDPSRGSAISLEDSPTIMYIPGFGEDIVNKASFAAELMLRGAHVILPGQNREGMDYDNEDHADPISSQAYNYLDVLSAAKRDGETVHFAAHSLGAPVVERMVELQPYLFSDSHIFMLAPACSIEKERYPQLGFRWLRMMASEMNPKRPMEFPDPKGVTGTASAKVLLSNVSRTLHEVRALRKQKINYRRLAGKVGGLSVYSYAEDRMFPGMRMISTMRKAPEVEWSTPVDVFDRSKKYPGAGATHDDEQFTPSRVVRVILDRLIPGSQRVEVAA